MNDKRVARINHGTECDHPNTAHERKMCRQRRLDTVHGRVAAAASKSKTEAVAPVSPPTYTIGGALTVLDAVVEALSSLGDVGFMQVQVGIEGGRTLDAQLAEDWSWSLQVIE